MPYRVLSRVEVAPAVSDPAAKLRSLRERRRNLIEDHSVAVEQPLVLPSSGDIDRRHEATKRITGRGATGVDPQLGRPVGHRERLIPAAKQGQDINPPGDQVQSPGRNLARLNLRQSLG